jgi:hypothetical protein
MLRVRRRLRLVCVIVERPYTNQVVRASSVDVPSRALAACNNKEVYTHDPSGEKVRQV